MTIKSNKQPYKVLLGNRLYLKVETKFPDSNLQIGESAKKELIQQAAEELHKAVIYDVGTTATGFDVGDVVCPSKSGIQRGEWIPIDDNTIVLCINPLDVMHIW